MIELRGVTKTYSGRRRTTVVANDINYVFPSGQAIALMGRNGAGKSTLLSMIAGTVLPDHGEILRHGRVSYPVGFAGSFHPDMTGEQNARFVARIYGVDSDALVTFVQRFAALGHHFQMPFRSYSSGMRSRLAFGVSMAIPFDTYLVDEVTSVGDAEFRARSERIFKMRMQTAGAIFVSHSPGMMRKFCTAGAVLDQGRLIHYDDLDEAIAHYEQMVGKDEKSTAEQRIIDRDKRLAEAEARKAAAAARRAEVDARREAAARRRADAAPGKGPRQP